jgi:RHS repeat-associated protein
VKNELVKSYAFGGGTSAVYNYDLNGNLNYTAVGANKWNYAWDVPGHLVKATLNGAAKGVYAYDGLGRRVESVEATTTTLYAYGGTESLCELVPGVSSSDFIYAAGMRIAKVSATTNYYHTDALGSTRLVTDGSKNILFSDNYQPYGQDNGTPTGSQTYKFTGKPYSISTGLYYYYHRWYDPSIGRFISKDPFPGFASNPETLNPYVYVADTPTTLTDRTGMFQGSGVENRCEKLHEKCPGPPSAMDILVTKLNIGLDIIGGGAVLCVLVCPAILGALGIGASTGAGGVGTTAVGACLKNEQECATGVDTVVKDLIDSGSTTAIDLATKDATDSLVDTSAFWRTTENGGYDLERTEIHHLLPRQFQAFFRSRDLGIDDYTVQLDRGVHSVLHGRGGSYFGSWNGLWQGFIWNNPSADQSDVLGFLGMMLGDFGF